MKQNKNLKLVLVILLIVLISMISFGGLYIQNKGIMKNVIPDYLLEKDLKGYRMVELVVSDDVETVSYDAEGKKIASTDTTTEVANKVEEKVNSEESLTSENYKKSKEVIEKRLENLNVKDYEIRQNSDNGNIIIELAENDEVDRVVGNICTQGKFEVLDKDTQEVLMTNADVESVKSGYGTTSSGTSAIFINIQFNKEGTEKFKNITNNYVVKNEKVIKEDGTETEETVTKQILLNYDGTTLLTTYFDQEITNGIMQLTLNVTKDSTAEEIQEALLEANSLSSVLDSGNLPIVYEVEQNKYIFSEIEQKDISVFIAIVITVVTIGIIYLVVKYKEKGILVGISLIGYIALLLITLRYTNVGISIPGLVAIVFSIALDYLMILSMVKKEKPMKVIKKYALMYIPVLIASVVFTLTNLTIGAVLFWSIVIILLYNLVIAKTLLK